jgi:hypothetical protein
MRKGLAFLKLTLITISCLPVALTAQTFPFTWDQATVYSIVDSGSIQGRDFKRVKQSIDSGYFDSLGVNVLLLSAPYEHVLEAATAEDRTAVGAKVDRNYTRPDSASGISDEFRSVIDAAHKHRIHVVIRVDFPQTDSTSVFSVVRWLTDRVLLFGIDGFSVESADELSIGVMEALKNEGSRALKTWKYRNPDKVVDDAQFWMTGNGVNSGLVRGAEYDHGFDSLVNKDFQISIENGGNLDSLYSAYSLAINSDPSFNVLSFLSYGATGDLAGTGTAKAEVVLLLAPGAVQIFSGQELEEEGLWRLVGSFRNNHPSIAAGAHTRLSDTPYAFHRSAKISGSIDQVIVVSGATGRISLNVSRVVPDDTVFRDVATGNIGIVSYGRLAMSPGESGIMLLELVQ